MPTNRVYRIAVIPGDGIGKEVVPEGVRALEAVGKKFGFEVRQDWFDFASYDYYARYARMMPEDWKEKIGSHDAIFFGAVGWPAKMRPPMAEYSPSVFSRTTQKSMSPALRLASGVGTPGMSRTGRRLTYWSNSRRNWINDPHSEM